MDITTSPDCENHRRLMLDLSHQPPLATFLFLQEQNNEQIQNNKKKEVAAKNNEWPAVVYFSIFGMTIFGYTLGRIALNAYPHPYHWLSALVGGALGLPFGWLWYRTRGDIF
ncbi:MAG: hypothetical protein L3J16_01940 [Anaerolineales bacterium]|nr:hypothetical protein [Anaerolineales bacterium]